MASDRSPAVPVTLEASKLEQMAGNERIKRESKGLFFVSDKKGTHTFREEVEALEQGDAPTLSNNAKELSKFFGIYKQQVRGERGKKTSEYIFMVRIRNPAGGRIDPGQWVALDEAAEQFANGTLRITSRQGIQYHRVTGRGLAPLIRHLNRGYGPRATLSACGDVNRNVMCSPIDGLDPEHDCRGLELAHAIAEELSPRTSAYFEVFLSDGEGKSLTPMNPHEPLYGEQYLPRKFKIGIAHRRDNSVDIRTHDIGFVPVDDDGSRFDVWTGGGLGMTHNKPETAALLGEYIGRVAREQVVDVARAIVLLQKAHGDRGNRKQARWKYTMRRIGIAATRQALREQYEIALEDAEPVMLPPMELHLGWHAQRGGLGYYGISVENGRLQGAQRRAVREAVESLGLSVVLTAQQDLILCDVGDRAALEAILEKHGVLQPVSQVRANAMACPAKPTCGLAMTDAENVLPSYIDAIEEAGLGDVDIVIRMTGCPNNCARPPSAEIGIFGYGKNDHVVLVGGSRNGDRLAHVLFARIAEEKMVPALVGVLRAVRDR
ncbi:MAG: NADPH-dependent assimilatory sulfite reductase hemoprotein subunit, partial [Myxococcota bacterium]